MPRAKRQIVARVAFSAAVLSALGAAAYLAPRGSGKGSASLASSVGPAELEMRRLLKSVGHTEEEIAKLASTMRPALKDLGYSEQEIARILDLDPAKDAKAMDAIILLIKYQNLQPFPDDSKPLTIWAGLQSPIYDLASAEKEEAEFDDFEPLAINRKFSALEHVSGDVGYYVLPSSSVVLRSRSRFKIVTLPGSKNDRGMTVSFGSSEKGGQLSVRCGDGATIPIIGGKALAERLEFLKKNATVHSAKLSFSELSELKLGANAAATVRWPASKTEAYSCDKSIETATVAEASEEPLHVFPKGLVVEVDPPSWTAEGGKFLDWGAYPDIAFLATGEKMDFLTFHDNMAIIGGVRYVPANGLKLGLIDGQAMFLLSIAAIADQASEQPASVAGAMATYYLLASIEGNKLTVLDALRDEGSDEVRRLAGPSVEFLRISKRGSGREMAKSENHAMQGTLYTRLPANEKALREIFFSIKSEESLSNGESCRGTQGYKTIRIMPGLKLETDYDRELDLNECSESC